MSTPNKKRKAALQKRAWQYAHHPRHPIVVGAYVAQAFEDGYRAAMRDARKAVTGWKWMSLPLELLDWLRPLR